MNLSDKDLLHDSLATEKQIINSYSIGITESSCENLRDTLVNNLKAAESMQYKLFDTMRQKGWYEIKDAQDNDVQNLKNKSNQMMTELK